MGSGLLIVNADDWGRDRENTSRILDCVLAGSVTSVSAMVFMEDSERSASVALEHNVRVGLHLNLTTPFSSTAVKPDLLDHQRRVAAYVGRHRISPIVYHPGLAASFEYVVKSQLEEFARLYGQPPRRIDGHHHAHLAANVVFGKLLPARTFLRRNFTFEAGEKGLVNRMFRKTVDRILASRHTTSDYFFSLPPLEPYSRLQRIFHLAATSVVEVETHPVVAEEYRFLNSDTFKELTRDIRLASGELMHVHAV